MPPVNPIIYSVNGVVLHDVTRLLQFWARLATCRLLFKHDAHQKGLGYLNATHPQWTLLYGHSTNTVNCWYAMIQFSEFPSVSIFLPLWHRSIISVIRLSVACGAIPVDTYALLCTPSCQGSMQVLKIAVQV